MNQKTIRTVCTEIYRRFPDLKGIQPKVQPQSTNLAKGVTPAPGYLLVFQTQVETPEHKVHKRWVRVVINGQGKILKVTTSR